MNSRIKEAIHVQSSWLYQAIDNYYDEAHLNTNDDFKEEDTLKDATY